VDLLELVITECVVEHTPLDLWCVSAARCSISCQLHFHFNVLVLCIFIVF
jgi:hypothetical protein